MTEHIAQPDGEPVAVCRGFTRATVAKVGVLTALFLAANYWQLPILARTWWSDFNWNHGFVFPLFSLFLLYSRYDDLRQAPRRVCLAGLPVMIVAILVTVLAFYPVQTYWFAHLGMILLLGGLVLYLAGPAILRVTALPIAFLAFAMPWPKRLYQAVALPLQELAAWVTTILLRLFGVVIQLRASTLRIQSLSGRWHELTVAEACSGVRALMAFLALGVAMAYLEDRPAWQRVVIILLGVPIAIACNCIRVAITCTMYVLDRPDLGRDFMEAFVGMLLLIPAFFMYWGVGGLLRRLFVEVEEPPTPADEDRPA